MVDHSRSTGKIAQQIEGSIADLRADPNVVGIVLVGSAAKPYADELSDIDLEVVVSDVAYDTLGETFVPSGLRGVEFLYLPLSDFQSKPASASDVDHWAYESCRVLHDPQGVVSEAILATIRMEDADRANRIRLHFFEFLFCANRIGRTTTRGNELNARLIAAQAVGALIRLIFVANGRWPCLAHWTAQELRTIESKPAHAETLALELLRRPSEETAMQLVRATDEFLLALGLSFPRAKTALTAEVGSPAFRLTRQRFGAW